MIMTDMELYIILIRMSYHVKRVNASWTHNFNSFFSFSFLNLFIELLQKYQDKDTGE